MENIFLQLEHPQVDEAALFRSLHIDADEESEDAEDAAAVRRMLQEALAVARPKAIYRLALVTEKAPDWVTVDGVRLTSALVSKNLANTHRIVPYVATCGTEAEAWSASYTDPLEQFWADTIKLMLLTAVRTEMTQAIRREYFPQGDMSNMRPGSISAWPLSQQAALFRLMGDVAGSVGVTLTPSSLMLPSKSISGFYFSAQNHFETCRHCPLLHCPNRQEEYRGPAESCPGEGGD